MNGGNAREEPTTTDGALRGDDGCCGDALHRSGFQQEGQDWAPVSASVLNPWPPPGDVARTCKPGLIAGLIRLPEV
jgi:hypothetical protein